MKAIIKYFSVAAVGVICLSSVSGQAESLQEAIQFTIQTNPQIRAVAFNRLAREQEVIQAKSGFLPSVDVSYSFGLESQNEPRNEDTWPEQWVLGLRQNVFRGFATVNEVKRQKARVRSSAYLLQGDSEDTGLAVSRVYLNVLRQLEIYELAKENLTIHERIHDQIKLRSESGLDRKADLDQVEGRLALAQSNVVVTESNVVDAETDYLKVVGRIPENLIKPQAVDSAIPPTLEETIHLAIENQPILKSADADLEAREAQHDVAQSPFLPTLDIAVDQKWEDDVDQPGYVEELQAVATVRFNIFDGFSNKARLTETLELINEAREIRNNTYRQTVEFTRLAWISYRQATDQIQYLENYVKSTSETALAFQKQWNIGRRSMFDVLDIEAELINAKRDLVNAHYDKMFSQYRVLTGLGQLVHTLGLQWPEESLVEEKKKDVPEETPKEEAPAKEKSASLYISPLDRRLNNL
jgi:adhesin transport system outer membrane protein